jgi:RimJ/RimL family protein N-acetyltransferase|tara:strand:- start:769 stop:1209 length:441 start_codon:yes stop_codon:yes gene_type:complete
MIRAATLEDVPTLVSMVRQFAAESYYQTVITVQEDQIASLVTSLIERDDALLMVSERDQVTGMIGMVVYPHPLSDELVSAEVFWWMNPERRGGRDALRLMRSAEAWVTQRGARWTHMIAPTPRVGMFFERLGYTPLEVHYTKACAI